MTVRPEHADQMPAWVRAGSALAGRFPGFLGTGWVRPEPASGAESLARWEASDERRWWLGAAQGLVEDYRKEQLTGIEGWFDRPADHVVEELAASPPPPGWKQAVMIWFAFFPLSLATTLLVAAVAPSLDTVTRVLVRMLAMTPIMTYAVLPFLTSQLEWWLQGRPAPWRSDAPDAAPQR